MYSMYLEAFKGFMEPLINSPISHCTVKAALLKDYNYDCEEGKSGNKQQCR